MRHLKCKWAENKILELNERISHLERKQKDEKLTKELDNSGNEELKKEKIFRLKEEIKAYEAGIRRMQLQLDLKKEELLWAEGKITNVATPPTPKKPEVKEPIYRVTVILKDEQLCDDGVWRYTFGENDDMESDTKVVKISGYSLDDVFEGLNMDEIESLTISEI